MYELFVYIYMHISLYMCLSIDGNLFTPLSSVDIYTNFQTFQLNRTFFLWKNQHLSAQASVFDAEKTANGFFQGFSSKVPCDMMYKKDGMGCPTTILVNRPEM